MSTQTEAQPAAAVATEQLTYREAVNAAMHDAFAADPSVLLLGEDVTRDGGVFKTNAGLDEAFPGRAINTPICENGFTGVALGMAIMGMRPIVEFMFADFMPTAGDAIVNQLPKYRFMSGGQFSVPVTLRVISGAGGRFGTQHSATGESWYMAQPGMRVALAGTPGSAYELLRAAIASDDPVIVHEHKLLYGRKGAVDRGRIAEMGKASVERSGRDVTIVASLLMVERALQAAETLAAEGIDAEVIDLRWVRPLDMETIGGSVARTGRLVVAEEQWHEAGWGATVISRLATSGATMTSAPRAVSLPDDLLIPYSPPLEDAFIPSAERIADAAARERGRVTTSLVPAIDRGALQIERIETLALRAPLARRFEGSAYSMTNRTTIITRLYTRDGVVGEVYNGDTDVEQPIVLDIIHDELAPRIIGRSASDPEGAWLAMEPSTNDILRDKGLALQAMACLDTAIWDVLARAVGVPLHRLWGSVTDSLPMSVIGGYYHLDADATQRVVADYASRFSGHEVQGRRSVAGGGCRARAPRP